MNLTCARSISLIFPAATNRSSSSVFNREMASSSSICHAPRRIDRTIRHRQTLNLKRTWLRAIPKRESCILGKIFIEDIDADGTLTAKYFWDGEIRLVASEGYHQNG